MEELVEVPDGVLAEGGGAVGEEDKGAAAELEAVGEDAADALAYELRAVDGAVPAVGEAVFVSESGFLVSSSEDGVASEGRTRPG